jgi:hypothetical protein
MTRELNTSADVEAGDRTARYHDAVERMLTAILNEVAHADCQPASNFQPPSASNSLPHVWL